MKEVLNIVILVVKFRKEFLDYLLLYGFLGLGKIIMFLILVVEMEVNCKIIIVFVIEKFRDIVGLLVGL